MTKKPFKYLQSACVLLIVLLPIISFSQQSNLSIQREMVNRYEKFLHSSSKTFHTSFKPYREAEVYKVVYPDSLLKYERLNPEKKFNKFLNVALYEDLLSFDENGLVRHTTRDSSVLSEGILVNKYDESYVPRKFYISVNPILNFELGYDFLIDKVVGMNTRGLALKANIGSKVSLYTAFTETQGKFPFYITENINQTKVAPGEGKVKPFKKTGFDFSGVTGYLSYSPVKHLNLEIGHGKHFVGDGYRSLLLSDNSFVYPYARVTVNFWRIKYSWILSEMINNVDATRDFTLGFPRKTASFIYASANLTSWLEVGFFEGIIWNPLDENGNKRFNGNILNPIIGIRSLQKNLDNNAVYGMNVKFSLPQSIVLYGQLMVDKFSKDGLKDYKSRTGLQAGMKYFDAFTLPNLLLQGEVNVVRPYSYSSGDTILEYSHYGQALAHPLGANFVEIVGMLDYRYKRFYGALRLSYVKTAVDRSGFNDGTDIFKDNSVITFDGNTNIGQGTPYNIVQNEIRFGYILNPKINLTIETRIVNRNLNFSNASIKNNMLFFTISTQLFNHYYDFALSLE